VKRKYQTHPLYRILYAPCKTAERELTVFRLSPEEVFADILAVLDRMKEDPDGAESLCLRLWDDLYCDYREAAEAARTVVPEAELARAVSITMLGVAVCLDASATPFFRGLAYPLLRSAASHRPLCDAELLRMGADLSSSADFSRWIQGYMESDEFMTNEDGMIDMADDDGGKCVTLTQALGQDAGRTIHVENMNIFGGNSRQVSTQGGPAFNDGIFNGGTKFSTDKSPEIKSLEQKKK
jgi:hypothetical protein